MAGFGTNALTGWWQALFDGDSKPQVSVDAIPHGANRFSDVPPATLQQAIGAGLHGEARLDGCMGKKSYGPWLVNRSPRRVPPPQDPGAAGRGPLENLLATAPDVGFTQIRIMLTAGSGKTIIILGFRMKALHRGIPPAKGSATMVELMDTGGCGGGESHYMRASLDDPDPIAVPDASAKEPNVQYYTVKDGQSIQFDIVVSTQKCNCTWVPQVYWQQDGQTRVTTYAPDLPGGVYRTAADIGYDRLAWGITQVGRKLTWSAAQFDPSLEKP